MNTNNFDSAFKMLNDKQREAVETIYGPVMVIAGPGSWKTQLLSARIAYILQNTDYLPNNILCLTFTENAAKNMRQRLATMIGHEAYKVAIHTFHSFGNEIINRYRAYAREYSEAKVIDDISSSKILDDILDKLPWDHPYKPGYTASDMIYELKNTIADLKKGGLTPEMYQSIIENNTEAIKILNPLVEKYFSQIDVLWRKKEDNTQKIEWFLSFAKEVKDMWTPFSSGRERIQDRDIGWEEKIWWYQNFLEVFQDGIAESLLLQDEKWSTKFLTAWKTAWTQKHFSWKRVLKESSKLEKQKALWEVFQAYQETLKTEWYIDFSDMILEALRLIETHDEIRMNLAENYQCVMIDEFQDTNEAQMQLIHSITSVNPDEPNIFAVGDDDQSIYKFQWANTRNLSSFAENYEGTKLIILEKNYRSKSEIIELSRSLLTPEFHSLEHIFPGKQKQFKSHSWAWWEIWKLVFKNELEECAYIADDIQKKIHSWTAPEDVAIIAKKNKSLELLAKSLLEKNIPVYVSKEESLLDVPEVQIIVQILKLIHILETGSSRDHSELLASVISHPCFAIDRLTLWKLSRNIYHARKEGTKSWIENLRTHEDPMLRDMAHFLIELTQLSRNARLEDIIDHITWASSLSLPSDYDEEWEKKAFELTLLSGEIKEYTSPVYWYFFWKDTDPEWIIYAKSLANIRKFVETIRSYKQWKTFLLITDAIEILSLIEKYKVPLSSSHLIWDAEKSVSLITVHKAKGLEWKHVYVPFLTSSEYKIGKFWGSPLPKNLPLEAEKDAEEDIERLAYTALTRAELSLTLSYSQMSQNEKTLELLPCFGSQIEEFTHAETQWSELITQTLELSWMELFTLPYLWNEIDFLREQVWSKFMMNATALQSFLDIVDAGPEMFVKRNLLRFPQSKNIAASYWSAMHKWLEDFFHDYTEKGTYSQKVLLDWFETSLKWEWFAPQTQSDFLEKGRDNLLALYPGIVGKKYGPLALEYDFRSAYGWIFLQNPDGEAVRLTWKIDRIEVLEDESLIITDYKTGKWFDDFTFKWPEYLKVKQWKYKLQLCFYSILFELSPRWRGYARKQYELFFVEKNMKEDRFHVIWEYIQEWEKERTKKLILAVMNKIQNLDFPDTSAYPKTLEGIRQFEDDLIEGKI